MPEIAEKAELSVATAYRFFPSMEDLRSEYLRSVIEQLADFSESSQEQGRSLFDQVLAEWLRLQTKFGDAIISLRSSEGYLTRLRRGEAVIATTRRAWEEPIRQLLGELGMQPIPIDEALYLHNLLFDPRDVKDLRTQLGWTEPEIRRRLTKNYCALLRSWTTEADG
ncbi:TetR/AcrR family transcriptional regulator [Brevibacterium sediminis]|uniref:TetR/AcrR family transcriptional regulator n=1 Tax=Brevibacterium sediminis TaxID=1857024 RepID=UPI0021753527|nr:TetR/AcrR family transcriptional regulator [Brevibacterium sediminis]MCS4593312.1 TetR/AcrR family transcriptional regulator [Brevibacterium sediminis]